MLTACTHGDGGTESRLYGTWQGIDIEEAEEMTVGMEFTYVYKSDNMFDLKINYTVLEPVEAEMAVMTYSGKWTATKNEIVNQINKETVKIDFDQQFLKQSLVDVPKLRHDIIEDLENGGYEEKLSVIKLTDADIIIERQKHTIELQKIN